MTRIVVRVAALLAAPILTAVSALVPANAAPAARSGFSLDDAPIPASCQHAATTLDGTTKDFGEAGFAQLETKYARYGHLKGHRGKVAVVPLVCSAGGVTWPQYLLLYQKGGRSPALIGTVPLGTKAVDQEHEDVTGMRFSHGKVHVNWHGYDGAGFTIAPYRGTLGWHKRHVTWKHTGPLVIDYATGPSDSDSGVSVTGAGQARYMLAPAPKPFTSFIQREYDKLAASASGCDGQAAVNVERYSHKGFAVGGEGACGGAAYLWARIGGKWKSILEWQDYPQCDRLTKLQRRGYVATGQACWNAKTQQPVTLGNWPASGI